MTDYVELHARSAFSFLRGAATPEELIAAGAELKMPAMALLDNDGVYGAARFHLAAKKIGIIKAHIGAEIAVSSFEFRVSISKTRKQNSRFQIPDSRVQSPNSKAGRYTSNPRPQSHRIPKSLPPDHFDEITRAQACETRRMCSDNGRVS